MNVRQREERFDQMREKIFTEPTERQTRQCDAELRCRKIRVQVRANVLREPCPRIPLLHQRIELARAHFDDREFARDEKSVQADQRRDHRQFKDYYPRRVPLRNRCVGERQKLKEQRVHFTSARGAPEKRPLVFTSWTSSRQGSGPGRRARETSAARL